MLKKLNKLIVLGFALSLVLFIFSTSFAFEKAKFAVVTDTHMALYGEDGMKMGASSCKIVENTCKALNKIDDLDFVVVTGDLLLDGEPWNLDLMKAYLDDLRVPYYVICGNHDYAQAKTAKPGAAPYVAINKAAVIWTFQGHGYRGADGWWGADPMPGLHLIGLDSNVPINWGGHIPLSEMKFLDKELYANQDKVNVVFCHHNFVAWCKDDELGGKFDKFQVDNGAEVRKIFEKYVPSVQLVLTGHRHIGLRHQKINGINYIVNPAAVSYPNQFTIYTLTPDSISYETKWVPVEKEIIATGKANLLGKPGNWWRPSDAPVGAEGDKVMLTFFEGPGDLLKKGTIELKPIAQ
ncbi:MAG: metallophosphoesterase [Deltaproteobacteria bacterium]|nr:metallophosphoesterase [Deltaproteobacteria bacterium]